MLRLRITLAVAICLSPAAALADEAKEREKKELRFVEIIRTGLRSPPPTDQAARKATMDELRTLMFSLAGIDPKNPPPDASAKLAAAQAEILGRRDPKLRDELLQQTQLFQCRSKQGEARVGLKTIGRMQADWLTEKKKYAATLKELDAEMIVQPRRYAYTVVQATAKAYRIRATGKDDMAGDVWEVDQAGEPSNPTNLCKKFQPAGK